MGLLRRILRRVTPRRTRAEAAIRRALTRRGVAFRHEWESYVFLLPGAGLTVRVAPSGSVVVTRADGRGVEFAEDADAVEHVMALLAVDTPR